jgi:hypothetical protein
MAGLEGTGIVEGMLKVSGVAVTRVEGVSGIPRISNTRREPRPIFTLEDQRAVFTLRACSGSHPPFELNDLEEIFRHKVFKVLVSKDKITQDLVSMHLSWLHLGFNLY